MSSPPHRQAPVEPVDEKTEHRSISVIREELVVDTVRGHTGTIRVRKIVREIAQSVPAHGAEEHVEIERRPVNRMVGATRDARQEAGALIIPVYEERLTKQLFLIEEIYVTRRRQAAGDPADKTVPLRHEEVVIERFDTDSRQWLIDPAPAGTKA